ncbi:MAG TPA: M14 family zinc carboxypeptidase [Longimicrobiales bacterium]|nr:M14 family zinc carboxypeptidase [Longimicrobiales bacterium]
MRRFLVLPLLAGVALAGVAVPAAAQHALGGTGPYDPSIPAPSEVLGYELGERFTPHHMLTRYLETVAEASPRVLLDTVAHSFEGREVLALTVTSETNQARLDEIRALSRRIADPRGASDAELDRAVSAMPAVVWLGYSVHGDEASGVEAGMATLYELAAAQDQETRMILDSTVVLIDPSQNPDGHERHVQDVLRDMGVFGPDPDPAAMVHHHPWHGARTSHYLFDLNRDWIVHTHPETRGRMSVFRAWHPHVAADLHEMGSNSTYFFAPPMAPVNQNIHPLVEKGWQRFAEGNAAAFAARGWGFFTREGYDEFFPGYGPSWPLMTGGIGMTYEQASSEGGAIQREDGSTLTLRDAARHHYTASRATLRTAATRRTERVGDYLRFRLDAASDNGRGDLRMIAFERDPQGRADTLVGILHRHGIEVGRLTDAATLTATEYGATDPDRVRLPAGTYVVDLAQPQGILAKALLEPESTLDPTFIEEELERRRTGQGNRFYDLTGWALPYLFRLQAWHAGSMPGDVALLAADATPTDRPAGAGVPARAGYAYAFEAGSEASYRLLAGLLADEVRVRYAPRPFTAGGAAFPHGGFVILVNRNSPELHDRVAELVTETGARVSAINSALVDEGTDLGSNSVRPIPVPRVALVGGEGISTYSFGSTWYTFDRLLRFPVTRVALDDLNRVMESVNVIVLPSGFGLGARLGETGTEALRAWVRGGGTLITLDGATAWLASEDAGLSRLRLREFETDGEGAALPARVPGAILRARVDTLSPLLAGVNQEEIPVLLFSDRIYQAPDDFRPGEIAIRYADLPRLRLTGFLWPEVPERVAGTPYLWTERVGSGRVIGFTGDPNFRAMHRGLLPLFANAVFMGGAL